MRRFLLYRRLGSGTACVIAVSCAFEVVSYHFLQVVASLTLHMT